MAPLLVIQRSETVRAPGRFCFPGGEIEANESEAEAVTRELQEELNISVQPIRRVWESATHSGVALKWWLVELPESETPAPNPVEVANVFWMQPSEIVERSETLATNREFIAAMERGEIDLSHPA